MFPMSLVSDTVVWDAEQFGRPFWTERDRTRHRGFLYWLTKQGRQRGRDEVFDM